MNDRDATLAGNLRRRREQLGISQEDLAQRMQGRGHHFHQSTIYKIEAGQRTVMATELASLAELLEMTLEQAFSDEAARVDPKATVDISLNAFIGARLRHRRAQRGWRQLDVTERMADAGVTWQRTAVASIERGNQEVHLHEQVALGHIFGMSWHRFLGLDEDEPGLRLGDETWPLERVIVRPDNQTAYRCLGFLRSLFPLGEGDWAPLRHAVVACSASGCATDEVSLKAAQTLGITPEELFARTQAIWGRSLPEERDVRLGDTSGQTLRTIQARRGQATRKLMTELRDTDPQPVERDLRQEYIRRVIDEAPPLTDELAAELRVLLSDPRS